MEEDEQQAIDSSAKAPEPAAVEANEKVSVEPPVVSPKDQQ